MPMTAADMIIHVGADTKDAVSGMDQVDAAVNKGSAGIGKAALLMGGVAGIAAAGFGAAVGSAMNFEGAMSDVSASLGTTSGEYSKLSTLALNIGRDTQFSATQGAQAIEELGKAGVSITDILGGAGMAAAQLASATGTDIPTAATVMSNAMNAFGLDGTHATDVADTMTAALNESSLEMGDFANGMASAGTIAASLGIPIEDTAGALALFSNYSMSGADAGTSLRTMLSRLAAPTDEAKSLMTDLGISAFDASGHFVGLDKFAGNLKTSLAGMSDEQRMATLNTIFGADAQRVANILYKEGAEGVQSMTKKMQANGQAAEASKRRMAGLRGAMENLGGSVETAFILFGSIFTPVLTKVAAGVNKLVGAIISLPGPFKAVIAAVVGIVGGFAGLAAGIGGLMALSGPLSAGFGAIAAGLGAILLPAALVVAAVVGLYLAWSTNFLGIRDIVMSVVTPVVSAITQLYDYLTKLAGTGEPVKTAMSMLPGPLQNIGIVIGEIFQGIKDFISILTGGGGLSKAFDELADNITGGPFMAALSGLGQQILDFITGIDWGAVGSSLWNGFVSALSWLAGFGSELLSKLGDLTGTIASWLWDKASAVDWGGILSAAASAAGDITKWIVDKLGDLTGSIASWLWEKASAVDWAGILSAAANSAGDITQWIVAKLGDLTGSIASWLWDKASAVDWKGILSSAANAAGDITTWIVNKLGNLTDAITTWLSTAANGVPWASTLTTAAGKVTGIATAIVGKLGNLGSALKTWYDNAINTVPWNSLGQTAGEKIGDLARTLAPKGAQLIAGLVAGLVEHGPDIAKALLVLIFGLPAAIGYIGLTLTPKALEFIQGFVTGLGINWPLVTTWLMGLPAKALAAVPSLLSTLLSKGLELLQGIRTGAEQGWPILAAWLGLLGSLALAAVGDLLSALPSKGVELITGVIAGLQQSWPTLAAWLGLLGSLAFAAVGSLLTTLRQRGTELISGAYNAVLDRWPTLKTWLSNLHTYAFDAVGSLLTTLRQRGTELISGAYNAVIERWSTLKSWLSSLHSYAFDAVGSLASTLVSRGTELISGLRDGWSARWAGVVGELSAIGPAAASAVGNLGSYLYGAGQSLVQGLIDGINSMIGALTAALSQLTNLIPHVKGPPTRDAVLLFGNGQLIMQGLIDGIDSRTRDLTRELQGISANVTGEGSYQATASYNALRQAGTEAGFRRANQGFGAQTVINYQDYRTFTVKVDDLPEVARAVEVIKDLERDHELVYGTI